MRVADNQPGLPRLPNVPLLRALWSLLDGIWGLLKGSWKVYVLNLVSDRAPLLLVIRQGFCLLFFRPGLLRARHENEIWADPKSRSTPGF